jgi:hypothetical protein
MALEEPKEDRLHSNWSRNRPKTRKTGMRSKASYVETNAACGPLKNYLHCEILRRSICAKRPIAPAFVDPNASFLSP